MLLTALAKLLAKIISKSDNEALMTEKEPSQERTKPVCASKSASVADESVREKYRATYYDTETQSYRPCYEIKFMGAGYDYGNFVDIDIDFELDKITIWCHTPGSGVGYGTGYYDGGGCSYEFPYEESLEYLNLIAFIREKTWIKNNFNRIISREEFERQLAEIGYVED